MLKWLTKKVYSSLSEVLGAVYKELDSLQPVDTDTVKWTKSLNGMKAHAVVQSSPVAMNQVQEDSEPTLVMVRLVNYGTTSIPKFFPVMITGYSTEDSTLDDQSSRIPVLLSDWAIISDKAISEPFNKSFGEYPPFAIVQNRAYNDQITSAIISGPTIAAVYMSGLERFRYCRFFGWDKTRGLLPSYDGNARILYSPQTTTGQYELCVINMGSGPHDEYSGPFTVGNIGGKLYLYHAEFPDSSACGNIYIGNIQYTAPKTELQPIDGSIEVWVLYDIDTNTYLISVYQGVHTSAPLYGNSRATFFEIASVYNGVITQTHKTGDITVTGRWV